MSCLEYACNLFAISTTSTPVAQRSRALSKLPELPAYGSSPAAAAACVVIFRLVVSLRRATSVRMNHASSVVSARHWRRM